MKVQVIRSKWLRGEGGTHSSLYRTQDGKMCCLGFVCEALGVKKARFMNMGDPAVFANNRNYFDQDDLIQILRDANLISHQNNLGEYINTQPVLLMININDCELPTTTDAQREDELREAGAKIGLDLEFVDDVPAPAPVVEERELVGV